MIMRPTARYAVAILAIVSYALVACSGDGGNIAKTAQDASPAGTSEGTRDANDERTGNSELDGALAAIKSDDRTQFEPFIRFTTTPCGANQGQDVALPPCEAGEAAGTMVPAFTVTTSEACEQPGAAWYRPDQMAKFIGTLQGYRLYAVYQKDAEQQSFQALFAKSVSDLPFTARAVSLAIDQSSVDAITVECSTLPELIAGVDQQSFVLPPRALFACDSSAATPMILCEAEQ